MILSILILSLKSRKPFLDRLLSVLNPQITSEVELLVETDSGERSIGQKRNALIAKSKGKYVCFVDDDDLVSSDYVIKILEATNTNPDCIGMHLLHYNDGILGGLTYHNLKYRSWFESFDPVIGLMRYYRNPNHLNPIKREHAVKCPFPDSSFGEDRDYSMNVLKYLNTQEVILEPIYFYLFRSKK